MRLKQLVDFEAGILQNRIKEVSSSDSKEYLLYGQQEFQADLEGIEEVPYEKRIIRTEDRITTLQEGCVVFSLISGKAAIVGVAHNNYFYAQSYVQIYCGEKLHPYYLVYLLNEDKDIRRQFFIGLQGSAVLKYTIGQLRELLIVKLPTYKLQEQVGSLYLKSIHLEAIKKRVATHQKLLLVEKIKEKAYAND